MIEFSASGPINYNRDETYEADTEKSVCKDEEATLRESEKAKYLKEQNNTLIETIEESDFAYFLVNNVQPGLL